MNRKEVNRLLDARVKSNSPIQGVCVSTGLTAKAAQKAEADFLVTYAGAMFRREGVPASLCELCYGDCNAITKELGGHILPVLKDTPLIAGIGCLDPYREMEKLIDELLAEGFSGVSNLPGIGDWEGDYRTMPEQLGMGYGKEAELIQKCHERDIFTMANCYNMEQAIRMTEAGADVINIDVGATKGGLLESACSVTVEEATEFVADIAESISSCRQSPYILFHGGPFATPEDMSVCLERASVHGILGGSAIERIPVEYAVMHTVSKIKAIQMKRGKEA